MNCYICKSEAVGRCYTCGNLFCAEHGERDCQRCAAGIVPGDYRADRVAARPLARARPAWWRPQAAEDFEPPACYACKGLARAHCRNCQCLYCPDHAGPSGLCAACDRSSKLGLAVLLGVIALMGLLMLLGL